MKIILLSAVLVGFLVLPIITAAGPSHSHADCGFSLKEECVEHASNGCIWDQTKTQPGRDKPGECIGLYFTEGTAGDTLIKLISKIGNWAFAGVLAVSSIFLIYAGFLWVTAGGDPQAATKARQMLTNALIGVVVALLAKGLVQVIKSIISG